MAKAKECKKKIIKVLKVKKSSNYVYANARYFLISFFINSLQPLCMSENSYLI